MEFPEGASTKIKRVKVGYYQRFEKIFNKFKQIAKLDELQLALGEDACQADMVACASPGWDKWFPDKARRGIENECVRKRMYLLLQLLQTRPKIIVFSGMSAFSMFYAVMKPYIAPILDLNKDTYITLRDSISNEIRLNIEDNGSKLVSSRLAISPHFSYSDNFRPQYRFSKAEWDEYSKNFNTEFSLLAKIAKLNSDNTCCIIFEDDPNAPTSKSIGEDVWNILQEHLFNAEDCIAEIILDEYNKGQIMVEKGHLKRSDGPCRFCDNQLFSFAEGCPYGKLNAQEEAASSLNHIARSVMSNTDMSNTDVIP